MLGKLLAAMIASSVAVAQAAESDGIQPRLADDRLVIELFAAAPQVTTPIGLAIDDRGRVLAIESHTHFRPDGYVGPQRDRIRLMEDTDGDGKADRVVTFHEGFHFTMDLAVSHDGWLYVATRSAIYRMRDTGGDDQADLVETLVTLDTEVTDQHNGLSGLAVDFDGDLYFGLGENYGMPYAVVGSDGTRIAGGGEGGSIYRCRSDASAVVRIATGFWNPFGLCRDNFGRLFATDNDPSSRPPNRLLHVVEGGDYGYQYQYGRSGFHPFVAWNGELPGTLGMAAGVGEGACEILSYESDGLPPDYRGDLLVASWGDHRVERYRLSAKGATFEAERMALVSGGLDFRPVGLAVGHDGSLYFSDWIAGTYSAHHEGRIWRVRWPRTAPQRPAQAEEAVLSVDRRTREAAARTLAQTNHGRAALADLLATSADAAVRAAALEALIEANHGDLPLARIATTDASAGVRLIAVRGIEQRGLQSRRPAYAEQLPEVRAEALRQLDPSSDRDLLLEAASDDDAWIRRAAVVGLAGDSHSLVDVDRRSFTHARQRLAYLLALRWNGPKAASRLAGEFLADTDPAVVFTALKWIADERLTECRDAVAAGIDARDLSEELFLAHVAALDRLDNPDSKDWPSPAFLLTKALDESAAPKARRMSLALVRPDQKGLEFDRIAPVAGHANPGLRFEAVRLMAGMADARRFALLATLAADSSQPAALRAEAIAGLAADAASHAKLLIALAHGGDQALRAEALRSLVGTALSEDHCARLGELAKRAPDAADAVARILATQREARPAEADLDAWLEIVDGGDGDPEAGLRIFAHEKVGQCVRCHMMNGRGQRVGPDLTLLAAHGDRRRMLQSILEPSREIAPQFVSSVIVTTDGQVVTGFAMRKGGEREVYLDATGKEITLQKKDIESIEQSPVSLMPAGLGQSLTVQEMRDLLAFLMQDQHP